MAFIDYYEVLQIDRNASSDSIKAAYRTMCKKYHPDTYLGSRKVAEERIRAINEAYGVLRNPLDKARYDERYDAMKRPKAAPSRTVSRPVTPPATPPHAPSSAAKTAKRKGGLRQYWADKRTVQVFLVTFFLALVVLGGLFLALTLLIG